MEFKRKCPRCNETLEPEDEVCPYCGYDGLPKYEKEVTNKTPAQPENPDDFKMDDYDDEEIQKEIDKNYSERANKIGALVRKVRKGDQDALAELIHMTGGRLLYVADSKLHDKMESENIVQEAFEHNIKVLDQLQEDRKFESWMTVSVRNRAINYLIKKQRRQTNTFADYEAANLDAATRSGDKDVPTFESTIENTDTSFNPEDVARNKDIAEGLSSILNEMPEQRKMILICRFLQGLSVKETAELLQIPEGTVKSNTSHGMKFIESRIIELRKQGKSFYTLAPIPFLIWLVEQEIKKANFAPIVVEASTITPQVATNSATSTSTATTSAAKAGSKLTTLFETGAGKAIVGVVAVAIAGTVAGNVFLSKNNGQEQKEEKASEVTDSSRTTTKKNDVKAFDSILKKYTELNVLTAPNGNYYDVDTGESPLLSFFTGVGSTNGYGYAFQDLDNDGQDELVIGCLENNMISDIYVNKNGKAILLTDPYNFEDSDTYGALYNRVGYNWFGDGKITKNYNYGTNSIETLYSLEESTLKVENKLKMMQAPDGFIYKSLNLKTGEFKDITKNKYDNFIKKYSSDKAKQIRFTTFETTDGSKAENETPEITTPAESASNATTSYIMSGFNNATINIGNNFSLISTETTTDIQGIYVTTRKPVQATMSTYQYIGSSLPSGTCTMYITEDSYSGTNTQTPTMSEYKQQMEGAFVDSNLNSYDYIGSETKYCVVSKSYDIDYGSLTGITVHYFDSRYPDYEYELAIYFDDPNYNMFDDNEEAHTKYAESLKQFEKIISNLETNLTAYVR